MILGFKTHFDKAKKEPTYFMEKILVPYTPLAAMTLDLSGKSFKAKLHSIRKGNRWKAGNSIQMANGVRTHKYHQFNRGIPELEKCVSVQRIHIKHYDGEGIHISIDHKMFFYGKIINGSIIPDNDLYNRNIQTLSKNDGFDSPEEFFWWFNKDFTGDIIHWTDLKY